MENKQFIACSLDESTDAANHSRMVVHPYVVDDWQRVCLFVGLSRMQVAPNAANLATLALDTLQTRMGLTAQQLRHRLVIFASNGAAVLHGRLHGGIQRVREQVAPFAQPMHCMVHRVDLSAGSLDRHRIMEDTKAHLDGVFGYYSHSTARREALIAVQQRVGYKRSNEIRTTDAGHVLPANPMCIDLARSEHASHFVVTSQIYVTLSRSLLQCCKVMRCAYTVCPCERFDDEMMT